MRDDQYTTRIEALIEEMGFNTFLMYVAGVCELKAEHLRCHWQDEESAKMYDADAKRIRGIIVS